LQVLSSYINRIVFSQISFSEKSINLKKISFTGFSFYFVIVRISDGRLGNQLFQFAFLATQAGKNEKIIAWGFEYLLSLFDLPPRPLGNKIWVFKANI
jgi:hypothetical protein